MTVYDRKECEGCLSHHLRANTCAIPPIIYDDIECPCRTCIVKVTCNHMCDKLSRYTMGAHEWEAKEEMKNRILNNES